MDDAHAGITTDMKGDDRWTIQSFSTKKANKKETPQMSESATEEFQPVLGVDKPSKTAYICAWCDADKKITRKYKKDDWSTTHGICKAHQKEMISQISESKMKLKEFIFHNNAGVMEVFKFFEKATNEEKTQFDQLINSGQEQAAWNLIEKVLSVKFQGDGPWLPTT